MASGGSLWLDPRGLLAAPLLPLVAAALLQLVAAVEGPLGTVSQGRFQRFQVSLVDLHRLWGIASVTFHKQPQGSCYFAELRSSSGLENQTILWDA